MSLHVHNLPPMQWPDEAISTRRSDAHSSERSVKDCKHVSRQDGSPASLRVQLDRQRQPDDQPPRRTPLLFVENGCFCLITVVARERKQSSSVPCSHRRDLDKCRATRPCRRSLQLDTGSSACPCPLRCGTHDHCDDNRTLRIY